VAGDDIQIGVYEDRNIEAEGLDALCDLTDLFRAVLASVRRIRLQTVEGRMDTWTIVSGARDGASAKAFESCGIKPPRRPWTEMATRIASVGG
jgi:hypothetical protein